MDISGYSEHDPSWIMPFFYDVSGEGIFFVGRVFGGVGLMGAVKFVSSDVLRQNRCP